MSSTHQDAEGEDGVAHRQRMAPSVAAVFFDHAHAVVTTFGRLLIVTDNEGRFVEVAVVSITGGSRRDCGPHLLTTKGTIE